MNGSVITTETMLEHVTFLREEGLLVEAFEVSKDLIEEVPLAVRPAAELLCGGAALAAGDAAAACGHYRQALRLAREASDRALVRTTMVDMARAELVRGRVLVAWSLGWRAFREAAEAHDHLARGRAAGILGGIAHHRIEELEHARELYEDALVAFGHAGAGREEGVVLRWLAELSMDMGARELSMRLYAEALGAARETGDLGELRHLEADLRELAWARKAA